MTKSLTEQWKDGELDGGFYYVNRTDSKFDYHYILGKTEPDYMEVLRIKEVLAPVPSYEEVKRFQEQLKKIKQENANHNFKAKKRRIHINNLINENKQLREQLKEKNVKLNELRHKRNETIEKLEQQLAEANELVKECETKSNAYVCLKAQKYFDKWGVK